MSDDPLYSADDIEILEGLEPVRKRPGMYLGSTDQTGLQTMLWEVVFEAVHGHLNHQTSKIGIILDGPWATVIDDGPGIPITPKPETGLSILETLLTILMAGCQCLCDYNDNSCVLGHIGLAVVNALSAEMVVITHQEGRRYQIRLAQGKTQTPLEDLGPSSKRGTIISFRPDPEIFEAPVPLRWDHASVETRARQTAALLPDLELDFQHQSFSSKNGLAALLPASASAPLRLEGECDGVNIELALQWGAPSAASHGFVCYAECSSGTHVQGLKQGMIWAFRELAGRAPLHGVRPGVFWELISHDLHLALHVRLQEPNFTSRTKSSCQNPEVQVAVRHIVKTQLPKALRAHPVLLDQLLSRFT